MMFSVENPFQETPNPLPKRRNLMGMGFFQQKEPKNARRPSNWRSHFRPQNCGRINYGHEAFFLKHTQKRFPEIPVHMTSQKKLPPKNTKFVFWGVFFWYSVVGGIRMSRWYLWAIWGFVSATPQQCEISVKFFPFFTPFLA